MDYDFGLGEWIVRPQRCCVERGREVIRLAPKAMAVLTRLAASAGEVVTRQELFDSVWPRVEISDDALTQRIADLRRVFGDSAHDPQYIETIPKIGFRLIFPVMEISADSIAESEIADRPAVATSTRWGIAVIGVLVILAVTLFRFFPGDNEENASDAAIQNESASIAVLPFVNLSADPEQEYFSDGLSDTLIHMLAQVSGLKVTAKTSSFFFKGKNINVAEIGRELNVGTLLEGSVQKTGNRVRVIAQLVNANDGTHLWSKSFDRKLEDIFAVQDEIATEVADALKVTLLESEKKRLAQRHQPSFEAYEQFIRGRHEMDKHTVAGVTAAQQYFKQAIELDPDYVLAYVYLAKTYIAQWNYGNLGVKDAEQHYVSLIEKALELNPHSGEALLERARNCSFRNARTEQEMSCEEDWRKAMELLPANTTDALYWHSRWLFGQGSREEALAQARKAAELDPMSSVVQNRLAHALGEAGHADEAFTLLQRNIERDPDFPKNYKSMAHGKTTFGQFGEAQWFHQEAHKRNPGAKIDYGACLGFLQLGDVSSAERCNQQAEKGDTGTIRLWSTIYRYKGEWERAIATLEGFNEHFPGGYHTQAVLADWIAGQGDIERARQIMAEEFPELFEEEFDLTKKLDYAIVVAAILNATGELQQRDVLLQAMEDYINQSNRIYPRPTYGIADVFVHTIRGDYELAIAGLREAIDQGWGAYYFGVVDQAWWTLRQDWKLKPLQQNPEFLALVSELEADIAAQRQWYEENKDKPFSEVSWVSMLPE